jgi:hypothetical protein
MISFRIFFKNSTNNKIIDIKEFKNSVYIYHNEITLYLNTIQNDSLINLICEVEKVNTTCFFICIEFTSQKLSYLFNGKNISSEVEVKNTLLELINEFHEKQEKKTRGKF